MHRHDKLVLGSDTMGFYESRIGLSHTQRVENVLYKLTFKGINEDCKCTQTAQVGFNISLNERTKQIHTDLQMKVNYKT